MYLTVESFLTTDWHIIEAYLFNWNKLHIIIVSSKIKILNWFAVKLIRMRRNLLWTLNQAACNVGLTCGIPTQTPPLAIEDPRNRASITSGILMVRFCLLSCLQIFQFPFFSFFSLYYFFYKHSWVPFLSFLYQITDDDCFIWFFLALVHCSSLAVHCMYSDICVVAVAAKIAFLSSYSM